ncbi:hypothetical protein [Absidia glauca]|uniref:HSF-type DNA-binding domain-containing protein n=1 Tax=Absidia glauca TaxID=4829 RepID=A0A163MC43_ABSGL|nr:hypothetical protein [Absidia glauca]
MKKGIITFTDDVSGKSNSARTKTNTIKNNDEQTNLISKIESENTMAVNDGSNGGTISINTSLSPRNSSSEPDPKSLSPTSPASCSTSIRNISTSGDVSPTSTWKQPTISDRSVSKGKGRATESESSSNRTQAAFVNKLYKMLEDESIQHLINWSENGDLFSVSNPTAFSKLVLPQYFKHNNWQSFVRQLNMYGFHKVNDMIHSNLTSECQKWEFRHQNFRRGAIEELQNIKRKSAKSHHQYLPPSMAASPVSTSSMGRLLLGGHSNQQQAQPYQQPSMQKHIGGHVSQVDNKLSTSASAEKLHSNTLCQQVMRMEDRMNKISESHDSLKTETNKLRIILSRQHIAMQDIADVLIHLAREGSNSTHAEKIASIKRYVTGIGNKLNPPNEGSGDDPPLDSSSTKRSSLDKRPLMAISSSRPATPPSPSPPAAPPPPAAHNPPLYFPPSNADSNKPSSRPSSPMQYANNVITTTSNSSNSSASSKTSRKSDGMPISSILSPSIPSSSHKQEDDQQQCSAPPEQSLIKRLPSIDAVYMGPYPPPPSTSAASLPSSMMDYPRPSLQPLNPLRPLLHLNDTRPHGSPTDTRPIEFNDDTRASSPLMGLGKESSLLNPQPAATTTNLPPHLSYDYNSIHDAKRRRTDN